MNEAQGKQPYACQRDEWLTRDLCPDAGSSSCPLLFGDAECGIDDEYIRELRESYRRWYEKRNEGYRSPYKLGS